MPDIVLRDGLGIDRTYLYIKSISIPTSDGGFATFYSDPPAPSGSITITSNGTYTNLSQYATVIINVPTYSQEDVSIDGNVLIFNGATTVEGNTLILASDASVDGVTLVFTNDEEEPKVEGNVLVTNGELSGYTLSTDGYVEGNTLIL